MHETLLKVPAEWKDGDKIKLVVNIYELIDNFNVVVGNTFDFYERKDRSVIKHYRGDIFTYSTHSRCFLSDHRLNPDFISSNSLKLWQWERV